ncbi:uncharacterized protein LOC127243218 isoform X2 [Andrographis paniculata]|uniref:uncharacterized protein LOC127243218 isoform X2 n=1 Tax=Andrographis paniculata TaxID=175694 RepID=UPI0021E79006|nr:uncharacterized protein LOC127243218 isoform X2 [Andrographis paniculata]
MAIVTGDRYLDSLVKFVENHAERLIEGTLVLKLNPVGLRYVQSRLEAFAELESLLAGAPVDYLRAYVSDLGDHRALEQLRRILRLLPSLKVVSVLPLGRDPTPLYLLPFGRLKVLELRGCDLSTSEAKGLLQLRFTLEKLICHDSTISCQIVKLVLRNNALTSLRGIENMKSLQGLDLSYNIISNFSEIELLAGLPSLQSLWLEGNPICGARWFRSQVFSLFPQPDQLKLDEKKISTSELWKRQIIIASRQKQPASFGFYLPVWDDPDARGTLNTKRKRISRLARIEDNEHSPCTGSDHESLSCDNQSQSRDENANTDEEAEIEDLVTKIECLKKDRSALWLQEFREWMNQTFDNSVDAVKFSTILDKSNDFLLKSKTNDGDLAETSRHISDSFKLSGDDSSTAILDSETSFADTSTGVGSQQYLDQIGESSSRSFLRQDGGDNVLFKNLKLNEDDLSRFNNEGGVFLDAGNYSSVVGSTRDSVATENMTSTSTALNDFTGFLSSSGCQGSPPHYQEVILQRRHHLEEEFLQLSAESFSLASSESNTSSEDDSAAVPSASQVHESAINNTFKGSFNAFFVDSYRDDAGKYYDNNNLASKPNGINTLSPCTHTQGKIVRTDGEEPEISAFLCSGGYSNDEHGEEALGFIKGKPGSLEKMKHRRKLRKRMISLPEEEDVHGDTDSSRKSTDHMDPYKSDVLHEGQEGGCLSEMIESPLAGNCEDIAIAATLNGGKDDFIVTYFNANMVHSRVNEICVKYVLCHCLFVERSECNEREVAILLSSEQKLYIFLVDSCDGSETSLKMVGCHQVSDVVQAFVGLGLQIIRVCFEGDAAYLFITRCMERSRELLCLLNILVFPGMKNTCSLTSLEQMQFNCFMEHVCRGSNINLLQYSMVLFCPNFFGEKSWVPRSLFILEGHLLLCSEKLMQFGSSENTFSPQYLSLDWCCTTSDVSKMIMEMQDGLCVTLTLLCCSSEFPPSERSTSMGKGKTKAASDIVKWKLKWFSRESLFNFVALMKAMGSPQLLVADAQ